MTWYVIFFGDDTENEYFQASSDEEAMQGIQEDLENIAEVYRCNDNETLSPQKRIYPIIGKIEEDNNQMEKRYAIIDRQGDYFCLNFGAGKIAFRNKEFAYLYADIETAEYIARQLTRDGYEVLVTEY